MPSKQKTKTFTLNSTDIDDAAEWFVACQESVGIEPKERVRARLMFEEALLNLREHYGDDKEAQAFFERRFGRLRLRLVVEGDRFNPLKREEHQQGEMYVSVLDALGMRVQYGYSMGANVLRMPLAKPDRNPVLKIVIALLCGFLVGLVGNAVIPDASQEMIARMFLEPISSMWVRLLEMLSGPIIFFMALNAAIDTKRISDYGGSQFRTVARYFVVSLLVVLLTMLCTAPFFHFDMVETQASEELASGVLSRVLEIIPGNLFEPFEGANTPQLLLLAVVAGYILAAMGDEVSGLKAIAYQANLLGFAIARQACALVPYFVGILLCMRIWSHSSDLLGTIWQPLVLAVAIAVFVFISAILVVSVRTGAKPLVILRKLRGPFVAALKRGTLDFAAVSGLIEDCKNLFGVDKEFSRATLPQGYVLFMPTSAIGIWVFIAFAAQMQHLTVDVLWVLAAVALTVVLAVATPPVTGANLLAFVVAFAYLNISSDAILDVMIFDLVFGVFCVALDQAILQLETIMQAKRLGLLDEEVIRAAM